MQMTSLSLSRQALVAGIAVLVLGAFAASPSFARDDSPVGDHPLSLTPRNDAALDSLNNTDAASASASPEAAMALSAPSSTDPLSNFGPSSGTVVGNRALELRDEVLRLRSSVNLNSNQFAVLRANGASGAVQYHSTVAAITARLQNGTTRGNPILLRQWEEANSSLDEATSSLNKLNGLLTAVDADASVASYLLQSIQAGFELSGAIDEDHDQLKLLRDEVSRLVVQLDYLRTQTTGDIQRETNYLTTERSNIQALAFAISRGELLGNSIANRPVIVTEPTMQQLPGAGNNSMMMPPHADAMPVAPVTRGVVSSAAPMSPREYMAETGQGQGPPAVNAVNEAYAGAVPTVGRLLVLIRYNQPVVNYEQQLSQAVGNVVEHQPDAQFSVVAVSPASGDPADLAKSRDDAQRDAEAVKRSLIQLGLPVSRISTANTQTQGAQVPEVHVYVR